MLEKSICLVTFPRLPWPKPCGQRLGRGCAPSPSQGLSQEHGEVGANYGFMKSLRVFEFTKHRPLTYHWHNWWPRPLTYPDEGLRLDQETSCCPTDSRPSPALQLGQKEYARIQSIRIDCDVFLDVSLSDVYTYIHSFTFGGHRAQNAMILLICVYVCFVCF